MNWTDTQNPSEIEYRKQAVGYPRLRNPFPQILKMSKPKDIMVRRVDQLVEELGFDQCRMIEWAYSQAVLAGVWSYEEGSVDWHGWLACADHVAPLLPTRFL